jgi:hypothetical protein
MKQTSAAPLAFSSFEGDIDGGIGANNPSQLAYEYARALHPNNLIHLVYVGTGDISRAGLLDTGQKKQETANLTQIK